MKKKEFNQLQRKKKLEMERCICTCGAVMAGKHYVPKYHIDCKYLYYEHFLDKIK